MRQNRPAISGQNSLALTTNEYVEVEIYQIESTMQSIFEQSKTNNQKVLHDMYILPNVYISKIPEIAKQREGGKNNG